MATPICWEQKVFLAANAPFGLLGAAVMFVLSPIYLILGLLRLPLLLVLLPMSLAWAVLVGIISALAAISLRVRNARPVVFVLALPLLLLAHFLVSISPAPTPADAEAKYAKWAYVEAFPYGSLLG